MTRFTAPLALGAFAAIIACRSPAEAPGAARPPRIVAPGSERNPFAAARFYVNPEYVAEIEETASAMPASAALLRKVEAFPTAVWLDSIAKARRASRYLDEALAQQKQQATPVVTVFVLYDLPGRDCSAVASAGELLVGRDEARYRSAFIDALAIQFRDHSAQRIVAIVEPDALANLATNLRVPQCAAAKETYLNSIAYAVKTLSMAHVSIYLDAGHAGWIGWDDHRREIARLFRRVLDEAGGDTIRGFSTNVANYNTLNDGDGKRIEPADPCPDELTYVEKLDASLAEAGIAGKGYIIDTSRNGRGAIRATWGSWCNVKGAGLGERPRSSPAPRVDAYFWVKPPGESDGASDPASPGYDAACGKEGSASRAPRGGAWFPRYFLELAQNAMPPL